MTAFHRFGKSPIPVARQPEKTRRTSLATATLSSSKSSSLTPLNGFFLILGRDQNHKDSNPENKQGVSKFPTYIRRLLTSHVMIYVA